MNVKNFRSILDETIYFDNLTALVGANGSGKSSFLHALELFQKESPQIKEDDFYNRNTGNEIIFSITFKNLPDSARQQFSKYIQNDELVVERVFKFVDNKTIGTYHGSTVQNPDFVQLRRCTKVSDARPLYEKLKQGTKYEGFPNWDSHEKVKKRLLDWEQNHGEKCELLREEEQFFGFHGVGSGYLGKYIELLHIPAVKNASLDSTEGKNSIFTDLMKIVVKNKLLEKSEILEFKKDTQEKYKKIMNKENMEEISNLSRSLTETLNNYVTDAKIDVSWLEKDFQIDLPTAIVNLVEDGYSTTVDRTGHGLQRAFIMTLLQYLSTINQNSETSTAPVDLPALVLIIEEPELYQHPNQQRHISEIFLALSKCDVEGVSSTIQVVYSTHSPHFVGLDRINQIRLLRKQNNGNNAPKITKISSTSIDDLVTELSKYHPKKFSKANLLPHLHMIRTPWINEGFFSKCVVLVEGGSDRAALLGASKALNINLEGQGISIIPCFGKGNLDKVAIIFKQLNIPTYVIWDNDRNGGKDKATDIKNNKLLLKLFKQKEVDFPSHVESDHACIDGTLETMLEYEIGDGLYETMMDINMTEYDLNKSDALKNPTVLKTMLEDLELSGGTIPNTLKQILQNIQQLANH